ncbi:hypothetical protein [Paenibacillus sp. FSL R7-0337]|uniref:hypothetical protein n=1 Tax=Paenibacillus sp. FSL R7-0337 TaxID=1926588 RepID=UPI00097AE01D|nr:hypothetical protein [Paenibacillus sp. FSL R7-0337]OMF88733.1 hypothetical protein BK147_26365 [Paenibacillus sp. FSL R7-0337]
MNYLCLAWLTYGFVGSPNRFSSIQCLEKCLERNELKMNFYLSVEIAREAYLITLRSNSYDMKGRDLIVEKVIALRNIAIFIEGYIKCLSSLHQNCVKAFLTNKFNYEAAAISVGIPSERIRYILTKIDNDIKKIVGEKTIKSISYAKTGEGILQVTTRSRRNMEGFMESFKYRTWIYGV